MAECESKGTNDTNGIIYTYIYIYICIYYSNIVPVQALVTPRLVLRDWYQYRYSYIIVKTYYRKW